MVITRTQTWYISEISQISPYLSSRSGFQMVSSSWGCLQQPSSSTISIPVTRVQRNYWIVTLANATIGWITPWTASGRMNLFFCLKNSLFSHTRFATLFFSMKLTESEKIVLVSCIIDFDDIQVWLSMFSSNINACKVMMVFFKIWPENIKNQQNGPPSAHFADLASGLTLTFDPDNRISNQTNYF